ncbi:MAG: hypothetical protein KME15_18155 [Drouetiella hepatica Uher 2000/2452]|jgi:hypothetical protein|uniref:Uncharacterized protein n=1 Tax=Drouetiella hepatica Uher 2000/2452 TaxID=904376 RepID=A0A951QDL3_9CYAN|nr:hypothetical protein [Drouetiella hepatica Uher 2000/2452]
MLKVTFMETGSLLEPLTQSPEEWIGVRVLLAMRTAQRLIVESSTATLLLRSDLANLFLLEELTHQETEGAIALCRCDADYVEVSLRGTWITSDVTNLAEAEGVFVTLLTPDLESLLVELWQISQVCPSSLWR